MSQKLVRVRVPLSAQSVFLKIASVSCVFAEELLQLLQKNFFTSVTKLQPPPLLVVLGQVPCWELSGEMSDGSH